MRAGSSPEVQARVLRDNVAELYGMPVPTAMPEPPEDPTLEEWRKSRTLAGG